MAEAQSTDTQTIAQRYFAAWTSGDGPAVAALLAPDFTFSAGDMSIQGRDAFLNAGAFPRDARTTMLAEAYQSDTGFQLYDTTRGPHTVRIVEKLTVRDGQISSSTFVADMTAFMALMHQ